MTKKKATTTKTSKEELKKATKKVHPPSLGKKVRKKTALKRRRGTGWPGPLMKD